MSRLNNPPVFQGNLKKRSYFEGWYIKCLSDDLSRSIAFIPGISLGNDSHAFIQVNTSGQHTEYLKFSLDDFHYETDRFTVAVGHSFFSDRGIRLDYEKDGMSMHGELIFENAHPFSKHYMSPGIMGPFTFAPFMECYHGVVSMRHRIRGTLTVNGVEYGFENGIGYIEKDWGRSFPSSWIWTQANPFQDSDASFMLSVARVPYLGMHFTGIVGFLNAGNDIYRFGTYLGHRLKSLEQHEWGVDILVKNTRHTLRVHAELGEGGGLLAPVNGDMTRQMKESLDSTLHVELRDRKDRLLFNDTSHIAGLEISGEIQKLS